jgi:hypothetical protein
VAALTTGGPSYRQTTLLADFLEQLDPLYRVTYEQLEMLYEAVDRRKCVISDWMNAVRESQPLEQLFANSIPLPTPQQQLEKLKLIILRNQQPTQAAQIILHHAVMNHSLGKCAEDNQLNGKSTVFIQQVALSCFGVPYAEIRDKAIQIWCEELDTALLTEMVSSVPEMPVDPETRASCMARLRASYTNSHQVIQQNQELKALISGLASKHRSTLKRLLDESPLSKVWTQERVSIFNRRLSKDQNESTTPSGVQPTQQRTTQAIAKISKLAPVAHAVLKTRGTRVEAKNAAAVTADKLKTILPLK